MGPSLEGAGKCIFYEFMDVPYFFLEVINFGISLIRMSRMFSDLVNTFKVQKFEPKYPLLLILLSD